MSCSYAAQLGVLAPTSELIRVARPPSKTSGRSKQPAGAVLGATGGAGADGGAGGADGGEGGVRQPGGTEAGLWKARQVFAQISAIREAGENPDGGDHT